ncbi:MAG: 4Fe-4S binding protein [Candidatus Omnitrophica bacterium]|nr:4Fe-4S binding protein [Candidatus Omnitrophota bacterium]MBU1933528.1 4Fe-4S binding protein [Candidatus Omnitrophota bacterium]
MPRIEINEEKCKGCELCLLYCPGYCIALDKTRNKRGVYPVLFVDKDKKCTGCGFCAIMCPDVCITVYK